MRIFSLCLLFSVALFGAGCSAQKSVQNSEPTAKYSPEAPSAPKAAPVIPESAKNVPKPQ